MPSPRGSRSPDRRYDHRTAGADLDHKLLLDLRNLSSLSPRDATGTDTEQEAGTLYDRYGHPIAFMWFWTSGANRKIQNLPWCAGCAPQ